VGASRQEWPEAGAAPPGNPFEFFDGIFCLNLDSEPERWAYAAERHRRLGIDQLVERFSAVPTPDNHHVGCALSWRAMIAEADRRGYRHVLVLEDDAIFRHDALEILRSSIGEIGEVEWDLFYLGGADHGVPPPPTPGLEALRRCQLMYTTHALAVHRSAFAEILADVPEGESEVRDWLVVRAAIDQYLAWKTLHGALSAFITSPRLASQYALLFYDDADLDSAAEFTI
jgi:hypothetical protein